MCDRIEVNYTRQFVPQPFPGMHSTPSTALPTESTTNLEDSFCKHSCIDSLDNLSISSRENFFQQTLARPIPRGFCPGALADNMQFLRTQPTKNLVKPPAVHTHTRSYDFAFAPPPSFQYLMYVYS